MQSATGAIKATCRIAFLADIAFTLGLPPEFVHDKGRYHAEIALSTWRAASQPGFVDNRRWHKQTSMSDSACYYHPRIRILRLPLLIEYGIGFIEGTNPLKRSV